MKTNTNNILFKSIKKHRTKRVTKPKNKTRKNTNLIYPRAAIIPHAGEIYAGECRKAAFERFPKYQIKKIIYISAIHNTRGLKPNVYELFKDDSFGSTPTLEKLNRKEHSYDWVEKELRRTFPKAQIYVITPVYNFNTDNIQKWIEDFMKRNSHCILLSTTDLTHYGTHYNNTTLEYPERLHKQYSEEYFLKQLVTLPIHLQKIRYFLDNKNILCGPYAILLFMKIMKQFGYGGKIIDYYDSNFGDKKLNKYTILHTPQDNFVSYVSIIYGKGIQQSQINNLDIMMALGGVKSEINKILQNKHYVIRLPIWSPFYNKTQGVFVGTSIDGKTNCSYGRYETSIKNARKWKPSSSTAYKIIDAAGDCVKDAMNRWKLPYNKKHLDHLNYKIELLDTKKTWKEYPGRDVKKHFKIDENKGIYLELKDTPTSFKKRSATYLPVVARENSHWSIDTYMDHLTEKAGGKKNEWKDGKVWIYSSKSYTWDPKKQFIVIQ